MGFIDFTNGEVLTADQMDLVMRQGIMRFADASARDTALSEVLAEGMMAYLDDTDEVLKYDGTDWIDISGDITGVTAGTALTGGGTSGDVTLDVDTAAVGSAIGIDTKQDDVITTQGDLVIGDASGDASRIGIGAADTVLTSNGTTATWVEGASGGSITLLNLIFNNLILFDVDFPSGSLVRFSVITTSDEPFTVFFENAQGTRVGELEVERNNPFTYFVCPEDVASIKCANSVIDESVMLVFAEPTAAVNPDSSLLLITLTETQSITTTEGTIAYVFGGGGAGGGTRESNFNSIFDYGGGGGSGYFATGNLPIGTYTATIGAGGIGSTGNGASGGTSSISSILAAGGLGGSRSTGIGGDGGSGGGGGSRFNEDGEGGFQGGNGQAASDGTVGGTGSGTAIPQSTDNEKDALNPQLNLTPTTLGGGFYAGGGGGARDGNISPHAQALTGGGGGTAAQSTNDTAGGNGGNGVIILAGL